MVKTPFFPEHITAIEGSLMVIKSNIFVHHELDDFVEVYCLEVATAYSISDSTTGKERLNIHLKNCLRKSKYFDTKKLKNKDTLVAVLDKSAPDFMDSIHNVYL